MPDVAKYRAYAGRCLAVGQMIGGRRRDDHLDRTCGFVGPPECKQAQRAVLLDGVVVFRAAIGATQAVQHRQRIVVRRRSIKIAGAGQRALCGSGFGHHQQDDGCHEMTREYSFGAKAH
ncbi:MAG TPA: hypothetical protein VGO84_09970 [Burkholderiales bacterium]|nr:hypothetical protein [Burkholderiales bacterium]